MAKLTGPLLSFGASGQIGKAMVVGAWRGIKYGRQYVVPANPRTTAQMQVRNTFAKLREMYKLAPVEVAETWIAFATGRPFLPFNKFVGENLRMINGQPDMALMLSSPGARGGLPPVSVSAATGAGTGEVDVEVIVPSQLPDGWTITSIAAAAIQDQVPSAIFTGPFVAGTEAPPTDTITLAGLGAAISCVATGWVVYERPDGQAAYSVSIADVAVSGA